MCITGGFRLLHRENIMKERFLAELRRTVQREGVENLVSYLEKSDFFTAPASTKFHAAYEGGLAEHSFNVYLRLKDLVAKEGLSYSEETLAVCGLLHDLCKANTYKIELRNVKENGEWVKKPYYAVEEQFPYGHGEKSVFILQNYIRLSAEEALAINWHMGGFDQRVKGGSYSISAVYQKSPLAVLLHVADILATYIDEERGETL